MTGVLVCDDAPAMRALLRDALDADPVLHVVGEAGDGRDALRKAEELQPDAERRTQRRAGADGR